jgi:hypothetical protein
MAGTSVVGYMPPGQGPFHCAGCRFFHSPDHCDNKEVAKDPKLPHPKPGQTEIQADGCCNEYEKRSAAARLLKKKK